MQEFDFVDESLGLGGVRVRQVDLLDGSQVLFLVVDFVDDAGAAFSDHFNNGVRSAIDVNDPLGALLERGMKWGRRFGI